MSLDGSWIPQDETEARAMEDIHVATRRAHRDGMSKERLAALLAFMASATLDPRSEEESPERSESGLEEEMSEEDVPECPECGGVVGDVSMQLGGDVFFRPCSCIAQYDDLSEEEREEFGLEE